MNIDKLNEVLGKAITIELFCGYRKDEPSLICISFPDLLTTGFDLSNIYPSLMELYTECSNSIHLDLLDDKITLKIFDKSNNILILIKNLSFDRNEFKMFINRTNNSSKFRYELIIGGYIMGQHTTIRNSQSKLFFDFCVINKLDK